MTRHERAELKLTNKAVDRQIAAAIEAVEASGLIEALRQSPLPYLTAIELDEHALRVIKTVVNPDHIFRDDMAHSLKRQPYACWLIDHCATVSASVSSSLFGYSATDRRFVPIIQLGAKRYSNAIANIETAIVLSSTGDKRNDSRARRCLRADGDAIDQALATQPALAAELTTAVRSATQRGGSTLTTSLAD